MKTFIVDRDVKNRIRNIQMISGQLVKSLCKQIEKDEHREMSPQEQYGFLTGFSYAVIFVDEKKEEKKT